MTGETRRTSGRARKDSFKAGAAIKAETINVSDKKSEGQPPPRKKVKKIHARPADGALSKNKMKDSDVKESDAKASKSEPLPLETHVGEAVSDSMLSLAESAVLKSSLNKSRESWVIDGIFERCWTKPSKKKPVVDASTAQSKSAMQKLGSGHLIVEPHIFDVTFYAIKENRVSTTTANTSSVMPQNNGNFAKPSPQPKPHFPQPNPQQPVAPIAFSPHVQSPANLNKIAPTAGAPAPSTPSAPNTQGSALPPGPHSSTSLTPTPQPISKPASDPVIQMLAQRASENPKLKELMKTVASGSATPGQLRVFQSHIDDLSGILKRQDEAARQQAAQNIQRSQQTHYPHQPAPNIAVAPQQQFKQPQNHQHQNAVVNQTTTITEITAVAVEFNAISSDRFLLPKQSILEPDPGSIRDAKLSFLLTRSGKSGEHHADEELKVFYQPMTIRLTTDQPRILQTLSKTLLPAIEAQRAMETIMRKHPIASNARLALRLRRSPGTGDEEGDRTKPVSSQLYDGMIGSQSRKWQRNGQGSRSQKNTNAMTNPICEYCCAPMHRTKEGEINACADCLALVQKSKWSKIDRRTLRMPVDEHSGIQTLAF